MSQISRPYKERVIGSLKDTKIVSSLAKDSDSSVKAGGSLLHNAKVTDSGPRHEGSRASCMPDAGPAVSRTSLGSSKSEAGSRTAFRPVGSASGPVDAVSVAGRLDERSDKQPGASTSCGEGHGATGTTLGRKSAVENPPGTTLGATRKEVVHETSRRVVAVEDTHLYSDDNHETSRPKEKMRHPLKQTDSNRNLLCNQHVETDDLAGLTNNRGRGVEGRPVRVRFKPD